MSLTSCFLAPLSVGEYWIVDPNAETVELYRLKGDAYPGTDRLSAGILHSGVVPGFEVPVRAVFDESENLAALQQIFSGS